MKKNPLQYDKMVEAALRGVVRQALEHAAEFGLRGNHHFYLTFKTGHAGVKLPEPLRAQYPDEMTIVLQHQFWGLEVSKECFEVTLSFNDAAERLTIPFAALTAFGDPSVKFGLQLEAPAQPPQTRTPSVPASPGRESPEQPDRPAAPETRPEEEKPEEEDKGDGGPEKIVSLDAFRKK